MQERAVLERFAPMTHQAGAPGRAPGPHATRPRIADTMQRVVACAVETDRVVRKACGPESGGVARVIAHLLPTLAHPLKPIRENTVRGCLEYIEARLTSRALEIEQVFMYGGAGERGEADFLTYVTGVVSTNRSRGKTKQRIVETAKIGVAVGEALEEYTNGDIRSALESRWDKPVFSSNIDAVVETLGKRGINGEALCWEVICKESLQHIALVRREANRIVRMWPERKADDLVGYGWRGLRLALRSYNPETAWFSTYACPKIRGAIRDGVRSESHLPKRLNTFVNKAERAKDELSLILGRHPTQAEVAEKLQIEVERVRQIATFAPPQSLYSGEDENGLQIAGRDDVESAALAALERSQLEQALGSLPDEEATAIRLLVMDELSMQEVRERTGASSKQLRARRDRGLATLRENLERTTQF